MKMIVFDKLVKQLLERSYINKGYRMVDQIKFCHLVWNLSHSGDRIEKGDGFLIHHKDLNKLNDDRKNLDKITMSEHTRIHMKGNKYCLGKRLSLETIEKLRKANSGKDNPMYGKKHSPKTRERMSINHADVSGENNPMYGIRRFGEDNPMHGVHRSGKNAPNYGKKHSPEAKKKIFEARKEYWRVKNFERKRDFKLCH